MPEPRVLIVEDDPSWQENFVEALAELNYALQVSATYEDADATLDRQHFHLVLIDLRLTEGTQEPEGMRLLQKVADQAAGTRTIIISGFADATIATQALKKYDAFYVIEKGKIDPHEFVELAKSAVAEADEQYRRTFSSAMEFLSGDQDVHTWAAEILQVILGTERTLSLRDLNQLRDLLNELLGDLHPLLHHRSDKQVQIDRAAGVVRARFWSKALGAPIVLKFGHRRQIDPTGEKAQRATDLQVEHGAVYGERTCAVGDLVGMISIPSEMPFEEFERSD
jgi:ActR/RegA family two-component response regulator